MGAGLYHQVAGLGSGFLQRELRVATVVSKPRILGKQIAQCDAVIQPQTLSRNLSAVQLDCTAPNLQLEQGGAVILRIKYQCTAVPHGHSHRAVAAAAVNDRQVAGANLARGRKAAHIQAVPTQAMSVQIQREGLAGIYAVRQHPVCQQPDGLTVNCRIQRGRHIGIIDFTDASRKLCPAGFAHAVPADFVVGAGKMTDGAFAVLPGVVSVFPSAGTFSLQPVVFFVVGQYVKAVLCNQLFCAGIRNLAVPFQGFPLRDCRQPGGASRSVQGAERPALK